jgi:hypothetical protein
MTALAFSVISCSERDAKSTMSPSLNMSVAGLSANPPPPTVCATLTIGGARRGVTRVRGGGGELAGDGIAGHRCRERRIGDDTGIAAAALGLEATRSGRWSFGTGC